jgi:aminoglycoside phosphotransferase (APT) family kinase protein
VPATAADRAPADAPDDGTRAWVARELGGDDVVRWRRLTGGVATATHELTLRSGRRVVLRRHHRAWIEREPWLVAGEAATLAHVERCGLPAPALLAADPDGTATRSRPAILMARVPGRIELSPPSMDRWLDQMASTLAAIHDAPPVPLPDGLPHGDEPPWFQSHTEPPAWSRHPRLWEEALAVAAARAPDPAATAARPPHLVHGDYQHFNLLWSRGRLRAVVDWGAPHGRPLDSDLGHCRLNLVILHGSEVAEDFLRRYTDVTGGRTVDPWWDLHETLIFLPTWAPTILRQVGRRRAVDTDGIHRRVDDHLPTVLRRL